MPDNASGIFSRLYSWVAERDAGLPRKKIYAEKMDEEFDGVADALSDRITKSGKTTPTANLPMGTYRHTGVSAATNRTDYLQAGQYQDGGAQYARATGTANAAVVTLTPAITSLKDGAMLRIRWPGKNTSATPTLKAGQAVSAKTVYALTGSAIPVSAFTTHMPVLAQYSTALGGWLSYYTRDSGGATAAATTATSGIVELATDAEASTATDTARAVTPSGLAQHATDNLIKQGAHTIFVPAGAMYARTTTGAASGSTEAATNDVMIKTFDFDASADEHVQFQISLPKSWNAGTVTAQFFWSHASTTTNFGVAWFIQARSIVNDAAIDAAFGTAVGVTDTGGTTDDIYVTSATAAITIADAADDAMTIFQVYRDVSDGGDTMAIDARLHGVKLIYTANAANDA